MEVGVAKKARIVGASTLFFCVSLFLTAYSSRNPKVAQIGSTLIHQLFAPFQRGAANVTGGMGAIWDGYFWLVNVREENERLHALADRLRGENSKLREFSFENKELREVLSMKEQLNLTLIVGDTIGYDATQWSQVITVDRGARDGVAVGQAAIRPEGVIGQVIAVMPSSARVLLLTDPSSGLDALIQRSRAHGVLIGKGGAIAELEYVNKEDDVQVGDRVITSGMDGVFPKGLVVGTVRRVNAKGGNLFQHVYVEPSVDFTHLEKISLVVGESSS
ncbi:MAG: rod shape-determining protein MreC [Bdellovibrionales bacterium]|nr:rod shape-determining protein MreC [Bdellovibrionales bacterium]